MNISQKQFLISCIAIISVFAIVGFLKLSLYYLKNDLAIEFNNIETSQGKAIELGKTVSESIIETIDVGKNNLSLSTSTAEVMKGINETNKKISKDFVTVTDEIALLKRYVALLATKNNSINESLTDIYESLTETLTSIPDGDTRFELEDIQSGLVGIQDILERESLIATNKLQEEMKVIAKTVDTQSEMVEASSKKIDQTYSTMQEKIETMTNMLELNYSVKDSLDQFKENLQEERNVFTAKSKEIVGQISKIDWVSSLIGACTFVFIALLSYFLSRSVIKALTKMVEALREEADLTFQYSQKVASSSNRLSEGSNVQATALQQSSASMEEITSMTKMNVDKAKDTYKLSKEVRSSVVTGCQETTQMDLAMKNIKQSSDEISQIIKTIDEIAFQTNILALNAAVEAARAGEAGKGFAVVADEVRSLAQRSAEAAQETSTRIDTAIKSSNLGVQVSEEISTQLQRILSEFNEVDTNVVNISEASAEQFNGITQMNDTLSEISKVVNQSVETVEEVNTTSESLQQQARSLKAMTRTLEKMVGIKNKEISSPLTEGSNE